MKILKKAVQKNVVLEKRQYSLNEINDLLNKKKIWYFDKETYDICYDEINYIHDYWETEFRIFTYDLIELKIALDENGYYRNIAIGKDHFKYFVNL